MLVRFCEKSIDEELANDDVLPLGINGCSIDDLESCKTCKNEKATEQCARLYALMEKHGKTPFGEPYPS